MCDVSVQHTCLNNLFTISASASGPWSGRIEGRGAGGSIQSLKFDEISPARVYMASIDGTVALRWEIDKL